MAANGSRPCVAVVGGFYKLDAAWGTRGSHTNSIQTQRPTPVPKSFTATEAEKVMVREVDPHSLDFPKRIPEKLKTIREHLNLTPDEFAPMVGARTGAEILAYENDEADLLVTVL